jgi:hypothetical protein
VDKKPLIDIGGNIDKATRGDYQLDVTAILKEAWLKTQHTKQPINFALLGILSLGMLVTLVFSSYFGGVEAVFSDQKSSFLLNMLLTLIIWPFLAGVEMMGIYHSVGIKPRGALVFAFLKRGSWVAITALFTSTIISIGLALFVLPGIFLAVVTSLAIPLVVEKQMTPLKAVWLSLKALTYQWFKVFTLYLFVTSLLLLSLLPFASFQGPAIFVFFIALVYIAPLFYNIKGILYREIFGMRVQIQLDGSHKNSDDYFVA